MTLRQSGLLLACVALLVMVVFPGCAYVTRVENIAYERIGNSVRNYCESVTPEQQAANRVKLDAASLPHKVRVECVRE